MSETQELTPLWDTDKIGDLAKECTDELDGGMYVYHVIFNALFRISGELEAARAQDAARIAELESQLAAAKQWRAVWKKAAKRKRLYHEVMLSALGYGRGARNKIRDSNTALRAKIDDLEMQLIDAQRYEPVTQIINRSHNLHADELAITIGRDNTSLATFVWPQEGQYVVMRRVATEGDAMTKYSHRNGDSEPPIEAGKYWFKGGINHNDYAHGVADTIELFHSGGELYYDGEECGHVLGDFDGQWWGPVIPPWQATP